MVFELENSGKGGHAQNNATNMATAVEKPVAVATRSGHDMETVPKKKKQAVVVEAQEEDPYTKLKTLQRQYEFLDIQVEGITDVWGHGAVGEAAEAWRVAGGRVILVGTAVCLCGCLVCRWVLCSWMLLTDIHRRGFGWEGMRFG